MTVTTTPTAVAPPVRSKTLPSVPESAGVARRLVSITLRTWDLNDLLVKALHAVLHHFGLASGSFDLAVDGDGEFHWLELNPNGQWGWLEEKTGLEMSAAIADLLIQGELDGHRP